MSSAEMEQQGQASTQPAEVARCARLLAIGVPRDQLLLSARQAAEVLGVSVWTLLRYRSHGKGPRYVVLHAGDRPSYRYKLGDLTAWLNKRTVEPQSRLRLRR